MQRRKAKSKKRKDCFWQLVLPTLCEFLPMRVAFLLLLFTANLKPQTSNGQITTNLPYLTLSSFNDNWGGGTSPIHDDFRSFGFQADWQFLAYAEQTGQFRATWSGLTNLGADDVSRLDELELMLRLPVLYHDQKWQLSGLAGTYIIGNLGGQSFQNTLHNWAGVPEVKAPYSSATGVHPFLGAQFQANYTTGKTPEGNSIFLAPQAMYVWAPGYLHQGNIGLGMGVRNPFGDQLQFTIGWAIPDVFYDPTRIAVAEVESEFYVQVGMRLGLASVSFTEFVDANFSLGSLGISLPLGMDRKPLKKVDMLAEFGALSADQGMYIRYLWNKKGLHASHFLWDLHYQFWSVDASNRDGSFYNQITLGSTYQFILPTPNFQVLPYASLRLGLYTGYDGTPEKYQPNPQRNLVMVAETGLRIKLPANVLHKNCYYGLTPNVHYTFVPGFRGFENGGFFIYGLGAFVMIDF